MKTYSAIILSIATAATVVSCRKEDVIIKPGTDAVTTPSTTQVTGFYLLNEGNMGSNKATLDYWDGTSGQYHRNIFGAANPDVPKEMGDVGNDLAIYGSRLYAVIGCSNKVDIMDAATARKIGQTDIPNCRHIAFDGGYAYVTSYAGPVIIDPDYKQRGFVAKIDTATMTVVATELVGYQPDGIAITGGKAYVANSGGYMVPRYERTVSVIDLATFKVTKNIDVAVNLQYAIADKNGCIWISSRGDYYDTASRLYCYDPSTEAIVADLDVATGSIWLDDDRLYIVATPWSYISGEQTTSYAVVDTKTRSLVTDMFITDGTEKAIRTPYGIAVNPESKEIYVTDALNHVNPGNIHCYSPEGKLQWSARTGDIPSRIAFMTK